ncbi:hypothetical protein GCM10022293_25430 [Azospirillum formosense]
MQVLLHPQHVLDEGESFLLPLAAVEHPQEDAEQKDDQRHRHDGHRLHRAALAEAMGGAGRTAGHRGERCWHGNQYVTFTATDFHNSVGGEIIEQ